MSSAPPPVPQTGPEYEFNAEQNKTIDGAASAFWVLGLILAFQGGLQLVRAVAEVGARFWSADQPFTWADTAGHAVGALLLLPLGVWLFRAHGAFRSAVRTRGRDVSNLLAGLDYLNKSYAWVVVFALTALIASVAVEVARWARG